MSIETEDTTCLLPGNQFQQLPAMKPVACEICCFVPCTTALTTI